MSSSSRERFEAWHEDYLKKDNQLHTKWDVWKARDAEVTRLVEALRQVRIARDEPFGRHLGPMWDEIDALLREYTPKEKP